MVTEGCLNKNEKWQKQSYFNYKSMRKVWQYHILIGIKINIKEIRYFFLFVD
ncbi:MAG: hypothetical protein ACTSRG_27415 [Candidatus Helarchaeota archaeon]